jgi:phenylacetate-CoA ligase
VLLQVDGLAPHFQIVLSREGRLDEMTVRVEARPDHPTERREHAAVELANAVKQRVGVTIVVDVIDPDSLERSMGKLQRVVDRRGRT